MKIALAQLNPTVGDLQGNSRKILAYAHRARTLGADLVVFPECCVTGYPLHDLVEHTAFIEATERALAHLATQAPPDLGLIVGAPVFNEAPSGKRLRNAALLYEGGRLLGTAHKTLLPTYDVFDERRHFEPAEERYPVVWRGLRLGLHLCEDLWGNDDAAPYRLYPHNPVAELAAQGADLFINVCASPFSPGKYAERARLVAESSRAFGLPFVFVNQVGANTDVIFDGDSRVHGADGAQLLGAPSFEEALLLWDAGASPAPLAPPHDDIADLHDALVLGIRDFFHKSGAFTKALIDLTGGLGAAVTGALAVAALGPERVVGVAFHGHGVSPEALSMAKTVADNLGVAFQAWPLEPAAGAFGALLDEACGDPAPGAASVTLHTRVQHLALATLADRQGSLLLHTGTKTDLALGQGPSGGGLAVLADVFKTRVYALAHAINGRAGGAVLPQHLFARASSPEQKPGRDALPPYDNLDEILRRYVEEQQDLDPIVASTGFDHDLVYNVLRRVDHAGSRHRQAPPGLRVSKKAFGSGRRLPGVMRWDHLADPTPLEEHG